MRPLKGLYEKRMFHGLSAITVGAVIGVSGGQYANIEKGKSKLDVHRARVLAIFFGCTIEELL